MRCCLHSSRIQKAACTTLGCQSLQQEQLSVCDTVFRAMSGPTEVGAQTNSLSQVLGTVKGSGRMQVDSKEIDALAALQC